MTFRIILLLLTVGFASTVDAQEPARILWARGHADSPGLPQYSAITRSIITIDHFELQSWPVGPMALPIRKDIDRYFAGFPVCSTVSRDGKEFLVGESTGGVGSWDLTNNTFNLVHYFPASADYIDLSPDGRYLAVGCGYGDGAVHVYDRVLKRDVASWKNCEGAPSFDFDGSLLLIPLDNSLALVRTTDWSVMRRYTDVFHAAGPIKFNPVRPGLFLVQGTSHSWLMDTSGTVLHDLPFVSSSTNEVAFSPSGKLLDMGGSYVLNLDTYEEFSISNFGGSVCFVGEDTLVATATNISFASISQRRLLGRLYTTSLFPLSFLDDGSRLIVKPAWAWSTLTGQPERNSWFPARSLQNYWRARPSTFSLHGTLAVGIGGGLGIPGNGICFWPSQTDSEIALETIADTVREVLAAFSPDSSVFAITLQLNGDDWHNPYDGHMLTELWSVPDLRRIAVLDHYRSRANSLAFSNDGSLVALTDEDSCYIWHTLDGSRVSSFWLWSKINAPGEVMAFLPGDSTLLMRGFEVRSLSGEVLRAIPHLNSGTIVRLPNGRYLGGPNGPDGYFNYEPYARRWADSTIDFLDLTTGEVTNSVTIKRSGQFSIAVNPITGEIASGGEDLMYYASIDPNPRSSVRVHRDSDSLCVQSTFDGFTIVDRNDTPLTGQLSVYNSLGECVVARELRAVTHSDIGGLPPSMYLMRLQASDGRILTAKTIVH